MYHSDLLCPATASRAPLTLLGAQLTQFLQQQQDAQRRQNTQASSLPIPLQQKVGIIGLEAMHSIMTALTSPHF